MYLNKFQNSRVGQKCVRLSRISDTAICCLEGFVCTYVRCIQCVCSVCMGGGRCLCEEVEVAVCPNLTRT